MSPYEIEVILWYYYRAEDHPDILRRPPAWANAISRCLKHDLLAPTAPMSAITYTVTERGRVYVKDGLCKVRLPIQAWTMLEGAELFER